LVEMPWQPVDWDVNSDGDLTITDIGLWLQHIFFLPGDWLIWACLRYWPEMSRFLEVDARAYGTTISALVSVFAWLAIVVVLMTTSHFLANADRALTRAIRTLYMGIAIKLRVARRLIGERVSRQYDQIRALLNSSDELELSPEEIRVLKAHAYVRPPATLALSDLVRATGVPRMQAMNIVLRLRDLELLAADQNNGGNERAYSLTPPGRKLVGFDKFRTRSA